MVLQQALTSGGTVTLTSSDGDRDVLAHRMIEFTGAIIW